MEEKLRFSNPGITKVVQAHELEMYTSQGWVLIQPVLSSHVQHMSHQALPNICHANNNSGYNNYGTPSPVSLQADQVVQVHAFLIGMNEESSIAHLKMQLDEAKRASQTAENGERIATKLAEEQGKRVLQLETDLAKEKSMVVEAKKSYDLARNEFLTLKEQLSKIKQAIGTKTYDEILA